MMIILSADLTNQMSALAQDPDQQQQLNQLRNLVHSIVKHTQSAPLEPQTKEVVWPIIRMFYVDMNKALDNLFRNLTV
jgi:hypothetical protein